MARQDGSRGEVRAAQEQFGNEAVPQSIELLRVGNLEPPPQRKLGGANSGAGT